MSETHTGTGRVLERIGFRHEGLALRYLLLAGRWTDQELWAITTEDELRIPPGRLSHDPR